MSKYAKDILKLHNEGKSYSEIQKILGCSKGTISYHLGSGQKEKTVGRNRDSRNKISKFLQNYKQERVCADCKEDHPYWMLEFDHIRNKNFNLDKKLNKIYESLNKYPYYDNNYLLILMLMRILPYSKNVEDKKFLYKNIIDLWNY